MKRKFLEDLGLDKNIVDQIMQENGNDINKAKSDYEDIKVQLETARNTIKERDTQIENLKQVDGEALQAEITKLQKENKEATDKYTNDLKELKLNNAIKLAINDKVFNEDIAASLFDKSKLVLDDDGKVIGIDEQLENIKKENAFLFKTGKVETPYNPIGGNNPTQITKEQFNKMGYNDRVQLYNTNKELYTELNKE